MKYQIYYTANVSLFFQIFIALVCLYGLQIKLSPEDYLLKEVLLMETIVQIIEICFYLWLIFNFHKINYEVTYIRYFDWFLTTPTMLLSLVFFIYYLENKNKKLLSVMNILSENKKAFIIILLSNVLMLFFGFLGEIDKMSKLTSFVLGSSMFGICFYTIYNNFVKSSELGNYIFFSTLIIWSLYGIASLLSYVPKNIFYNFLDIFSKNINGLLLFGYILWLTKDKLLFSLL